jgi:hypothetical protein
MQGVGPTRCTKFLEGQLVRGCLPVLRGRVVLALTFVTSKSYEFSHNPRLSSRTDY